ncbi:WD40-repeat-containing domain protein [Choanephora cucurbitarum]|nr:WD40-repeat-containing domain protein [Choanephora cucurbitarum]
MSSEQEQVQVRFITQQPKYAVNDAPMLLPSNIQKEGLSEIVNSLLDLEKPIPFDFLVEGQLLRTSVVDYLNAARLSTENVITVEYVESMLPPVPLTAYEHDDWISSVHGHQGQLFLTGAYDNMVRLWNAMGECTATLTSHTDAVKSVSFGQVTDSTAQIFSGSLDQSVLGWSVDLNDQTYRVMYECKGHKGAVESISVDQSNRYLATASADSFVKIWTTETPEEDEPSHETNKKRKKITTDGRKLKTQAVTLEGHVGGVNAVVFDSSDSNVVFTGGWDHSIRSWDIEQQVNVTTKVIFSEGKSKYSLYIYIYLYVIEL